MLLNTLKRSILFLVLLLTAVQSYATHIFGVDLYYTHVAGNTYTIHLVMYGDCSGAAFGTFPTSVPVVNVYNGNTFINAVSLILQAPTTGVEVTPVCPADVGLTTCTNPAFTIPGVKKFVYSSNVTLSGTSSVWRFVFKGVMGSSSAGRSSGITNITSPGSTLIQLVDTLDNTTFNNSSAVYTTIPTPFFCINIPANFNPGAVDPDGDSLSFHLVPGVDANTGSNVSYVFPYTATSPLGVLAGSFSFSSTTGQFSFTPNIVQKGLVVYNVEEFSGGVLRGTTQREMTVVVISPCTNTPPTGVISAPSAGTVTSPTTFSICNNVGPFNFHINPTDPDGNHITMTATGLPAGATFNIVGNGTFSPLGTFMWNTIGVAPGNYIFYISYQDDGCPLSGTQTIAYTITVLPVPTETYAPVSAATCTRRAVFHVTPGGSASPWTLTVIQSGTTIQTITGVTGMVTDSLVPGTYTIRLTNPSNCFVDTIITILAPPLPVPAVSVFPPLCPGGSTGFAVITATGGLAPYLYSIGAGAYGTSDTFTSLSPGPYTLHIKDANDCVKDTLVTIPNATPILIFPIVHKPLCNSFTNGSVVLIAYNSVGPYTYAIGSGAYTTNDTFTALGVGTYTFHVKNANGCIQNATIVLTDSVIIHATLAISNILCNGGNGIVTVTGTGGFGPPYTYAYNSFPFGSSNIFTVPAGSYTFHVHDSNACFFDTSVTLTQPTPVTITPVITNVTCNGTLTGVVVVNAIGGTPGYTYNIGGGVFGVSNTFAGLSAGTKIVGVRDVNGCIYYDTVTVTQPAPVAIDSVQMVQPGCNGSTNGSLTVFSSGGISPYTYALSAGTYGVSSAFTGLSAGTYTMHVKDANGCIKDSIVNLAQPQAITPSAFVTKSVCQTLANGKVTLAASGGTPTYTYAMGAGTYGSASVFTPLAAGTYTFHIKDAHGCIKDTVVTVTDSLHVSGTFLVTPALCYNQASGSIDATGIGGTNPYTYAIGAGSYGGTHLFSALFAGTYAMHIKDNNGCKFDTSVSLTQPLAIVPNLTITQPTCNGYNDGSVSVSVAGGTPAYTFSWNSGPFVATTSFGSLTAGTDSIIIKDANGCLWDTVFTILQPTSITISNLVTKNITCFGGLDGSITVIGSGATPAYNYAVDTSAWQPGSLFTGYGAGLYTVRVKDSHGCETDTNVTLTQPPLLVFLGADTLNATCYGYKDGSVKLHVAGGTLPYSYSDDNTTFGASETFPGLGAGTYLFNVKDANGCTIDTTISLKGLPPIIIDDASLTQPTCYGAGNGAITLLASGGVPPLLYQLNNNTIHSPVNTFSNLYSGVYTIHVTDSKNCIKDTTLNLPQPDSIVLIATVTPNECIGADNKGGVNIAVTGGTQPYQYLWSTNPAETTAGISGLPNGSYEVWVTDANNCSDSLKALVAYDNCCTPFIPDAFTPNNDGKNDEFKIYFKGDIYIIIFSIYNRFGQRVYSVSNTTDMQHGWDGKLFGVDAEMGVYYYYARITCGNKGDHVREFKGDVTLVR